MKALKSVLGVVFLGVYAVVKVLWSVLGVVFLGVYVVVVAVAAVSLLGTVFGAIAGGGGDGRD